MDKISIVVPVYNVEKYLERCVNSLLCQTYGNFEILLVNDGSTDSSPIICNRLSEEDLRVKVIHKENGGLSSARNEGLKYISGKYVCFIDSDDWVDRYFLEKLYLTLKDTKSDISQCNFKVCTDYFSNKQEDFRETKIEILSSEQALINLYNKKRYLQTVISCNKLFKSELFSNEHYTEGIINEDEDIIHRLLYKAKKIAVINVDLYYYYQRQGSITKQNYSYKNLDILGVYERKIEFFKRNNEQKLVEMTKLMYLRILLDNLIRLQKSELFNKEEQSNLIRNKLVELYKENLKKQPFLKFEYLLYQLYKKSPILTERFYLGFMKLRKNI